MNFSLYANMTRFCSDGHTYYASIYYYEHNGSLKALAIDMHN